MFVHSYSNVACLCTPVQLIAVQHAVVRLYAEVTMLHSMSSAAESDAWSLT